MRGSCAQLIFAAMVLTTTALHEPLAGDNSEWHHVEENRFEIEIFYKLMINYHLNSVEEVSPPLRERKREREKFV